MLRAVGRAIRRLVLYTLPLTFIPILSGVISGVIFSHWHDRRIHETTDKFLYEIKDSLNDWGVGGNAPTFRQYQDTHNDFGVMRINSNDWTSKLGFILPVEYTAVASEDMSIDKYADLHTLMRDTSCAPCAEMPKQQWVWLTWYGFPQFFPWDRAYPSAIHYANAHPPHNESGFFYAQCSGTAGFLCGVWTTRPYALVHFLVEDDAPDEDDIEEGLTYSAPLEHLRPVTVRIIEFPLKGAYTGLPTNVLADDYAQVRAMIAGDRLYEQFDPYDLMHQTLHHFDEHMHKLWRSKGTFLYYYNILDDWIINQVTTPMGLEDALSFLHDIVFMLTAGITEGLLLGPARMAWEGIENFLGRPKRGDWILGDLEEESSEPANIMDGMLAGFLAGLPEQMAKARSSAADDTNEPVITDAV